MKKMIITVTDATVLVESLFAQALLVYNGTYSSIAHFSYAICLFTVWGVGWSSGLGSKAPDFKNTYYEIQKKLHQIDWSFGILRRSLTPNSLS